MHTNTHLHIHLYSSDGSPLRWSPVGAAIFCMSTCHLDRAQEMKRVHQPLLSSTLFSPFLSLSLSFHFQVCKASQRAMVIQHLETCSLWFWSHRSLNVFSSQIVGYRRVVTAPSASHPRHICGRHVKLSCRKALLRHGSHEMALWLTLGTKSTRFRKRLVTFGFTRAVNSPG